MFSVSVRGILCAAFCALGACKEKPAAPVKLASSPQYSLERPVEGLPSPTPRDVSFHRGLSIELFMGEVESQAQRAAYRDWLDQAAQLGATDLELIVQWSQLDAAAVEMAPDASTTVDDAFLGWLMDQAFARKLRVLLTPVIDVEERASGKRVIAPIDHKRWFWSYHRFALHYARIAEAHKACCFAVGSDLPELDAHDAAHWRPLIADVRKAFKGKLSYGVRVDHMDAVAFWDDIELVSLVGIGELLSGSAAVADQRVAGLTQRLRTFSKTHDKPILLSSVSLGSSGANGAHSREQLDAARALYRGIQAEPLLGGVYLSLSSAAAASKPGPLAGAPAEVVRHWYSRSRNQR